MVGNKASIVQARSMTETKAQGNVEWTLGCSHVGDSRVGIGNALKTK